MSLVVRGGKVLDPASGTQDVMDIVIDEGRIIDIGPNVGADASGDIIDAQGRMVMPGLLDLRSHIREPGEEYKEDIDTASNAAIAGGFTAIVANASGETPMDTPEMIEFVIRRGREVGLCEVLPAGAVTVGLKGELLAEAAGLQQAGAVCLSEGVRPISNSRLMRSALEYSCDFGMTVMSYACDANLADGGQVSEGLVSTQLGLLGIPHAAEEAAVARDLALAELTGARLHISQLSCAGSVEQIRAAKARGVNVTADVSVNHLHFTEKHVLGFDTNLKVAPPLRRDADLQALVAGLADGTIDAVSTGHAPQSILEKDVTFGRASTGALGLQTALSVCLAVAKKHDIPELTMIERLTKGPADVLGRPHAGLNKGAAANLAIFNPDEEWVVDSRQILSKSKNSPFLGKTLQGIVEKTIFDGRVVYSS